MTHAKGSPVPSPLSHIPATPELGQFGKQPLLPMALGRGPDRPGDGVLATKATEPLGINLPPPLTWHVHRTPGHPKFLQWLTRTRHVSVSGLRMTTLRLTR